MNSEITQQSVTLPAPRAAAMFRELRMVAALGAIAALSACVQLNPGAAPRLDAMGGSVQGVYPVTERNIGQVRTRAVDTVNQIRLAQGLAPVALDPALIQAADGHSRSMADQGRAWAFGADSSTSVDRARRAGFAGQVIGELISETYETEVQAISTWMENPGTRSILLDPRARRIGLGAFQQPSNKLWWTLTVAN